MTEFRSAIAAGFADALEHEPSRLLSDADLLAELQAGDALAGGHEQVHRQNPLIEGNVRPLKDGASADCEVLLAGIAAIEALRARSDALRLLAMRADGPTRPAARLHVSPGRHLVRIHLGKLIEADGRTTHIWLPCP